MAFWTSGQWHTLWKWIRWNMLGQFGPKLQPGLLGWDLNESSQWSSGKKWLKNYNRLMTCPGFEPRACIYLATLPQGVNVAGFEPQAFWGYMHLVVSPILLCWGFEPGAYIHITALTTAIEAWVWNLALVLQPGPENGTQHNTIRQTGCLSLAQHQMMIVPVINLWIPSGAVYTYSPRFKSQSTQLVYWRNWAEIWMKENNSEKDGQGSVWLHTFKVEDTWQRESSEMSKRVLVMPRAQVQVSR